MSECVQSVTLMEKLCIIMQACQKFKFKSTSGEIVPAEQMRRVKYLVSRAPVHLSKRGRPQQQQLVGSWFETCTKR